MKVHEERKRDGRADRQTYTEPGEERLAVCV